MATAELTQSGNGQHDIAEMGFGTSNGFQMMQRAAICLARSSLVPERYRGKSEEAIANCVIALNIANRLGADPLMVMQNLYVVHGTPSWSAVFLISTFNQCGKFSAIRYEMSGKEGEDDRGCVAYAKELSTGDRIEGAKITIGLAKREGWYQKKGSKWQTMPEQMLRYRAAAWMVKTHVPELAMGLSASDEIEDRGPIRNMIDARHTDLSEIESLRQQKRSEAEGDDATSSQAGDDRETNGEPSGGSDTEPSSTPNGDATTPELNETAESFHAEIDRATSAELLQEYSDTIAESRDINEEQRQWLYSEINWRIEALQG